MPRAAGNIQTSQDSRVLRLTWVRAGVLTGLSVVECSRVESLRTVGLDVDGLEVEVRPREAVPEAVVVVVVFWVTWLPDEPPSLGLTFGGDAVRVLPLTAVVIVEMVEDTMVVVVDEVVLSGPLGKVLGLDRKMGSWPIPLASTRSVGT